MKKTKVSRKSSKNVTENFNSTVSANNVILSSSTMESYKEDYDFGDKSVSTIVQKKRDMRFNLN